jgi:plasmid stabilization system protein ParE
VKFQVRFDPLVKFDLADAFDWYEERETGLGDRFLSAFEDCVERIRENPRAFQFAHCDLRRTLLEKFPYMVFFRFSEDAITVVGCLHGRRDPIHWQIRKKTTGPWRM